MLQPADVHLSPTRLKSDLRGIEILPPLLDADQKRSLKSDLRGIEMCDVLCCAYYCAYC